MDKLPFILCDKDLNIIKCCKDSNLTAIMYRGIKNLRDINYMNSNMLDKAMENLNMNKAYHTDEFYLFEYKSYAMFKQNKKSGEIRVEIFIKDNRDSSFECNQITNIHEQNYIDLCSFKKNLEVASLYADKDKQQLTDSINSLSSQCDVMIKKEKMLKYYYEISNNDRVLNNVMLDIVNDIGSIVEIVSKIAESLNKEIKLENDVKKLNIFCDIDYIALVIMNLVHNSLKFSTTDTEIVITLSTDKEDFIITVKDDGDGISPEDIERIYTPFFTTDENSMGLGLALVKMILDKHSASIDVESEQHRYTKFTIKMKLILPTFDDGNDADDFGAGNNGNLTFNSPSVSNSQNYNKNSLKHELGKYNDMITNFFSDLLTLND